LESLKMVQIELLVTLQMLYMYSTLKVIIGKVKELNLKLKKDQKLANQFYQRLEILVK
jgi:hypothetical protein